MLATCDPRPKCETCGTACDRCEGRGFVQLQCIIGNHYTHGVWRSCPSCARTKVTVVYGDGDLIVCDTWACRWCMDNLD